MRIEKDLVREVKLLAKNWVDGGIIFQSSLFMPCMMIGARKVIFVITLSILLGSLGRRTLYL